MHSIYVGKRPGVDMFLAQVAEKFEVVIFTASLAIVLPKQYANPLIDKLDLASVVSYRLFRESCVMANGCYVKDLSNIGRDLSQVVLVDVRTTQNSPTSYSFQPQNAIPITSWYDDPNDTELFSLVHVLDRLAKAKDVAEFNLGPMTPETPTIRDVLLDDPELLKSGSLDKSFKHCTEDADAVKLDPDRSMLNSPLNRSAASHSFKFDTE
jgi:Dullard-like phosphatase family protein